MLFKGGALLGLALFASACAAAPQNEETTKDVPVEEPTPTPVPSASSAAPIDGPRETLEGTPLQLGQQQVLTITPSAVVGLTGPGGNYPDDIVLDASNNAYMVGYFSATMTLGGSCGAITAAGAQDMFIAKFSSSNVCTWVKRVGATSGSTGGFAIALDALSNLYVTGAYSATTDFATTGTSTVLSNAGGWDCFLASYDSTGRNRWATSCGATAGDDSGYEITVSGTTVAVTGELGTNAQDAFVMTRTTSNGAGFTNTIASTGYDTGRGVVFDSSGNLYAVGAFSNTTSSPYMNSNGGLDAYVVEYSSTGSNVRNYTIGGALDDYATAVALDGNLPVVAGAYSSSMSALGLTNQGNPAIFLAQIGSTPLLGLLYLSWTKAIAATVNAYSEGLSVDSAGNVYLVGSFAGIVTVPTSSSSITHTSLGGYDSLVAEFSSSGTYIGDATYGSTGNDEFMAVAPVGTTSMRIAGYFAPSITIGATSLTAGGAANVDLFTLAIN